MNWEKELDRELRKLKKAFWRMFVQSREFKNFKRKLKELNLDADIFLAMFIFGEHRVSLSTTRRNKVRHIERESGFRLTRKDKEFLKAYGIKWD